MMTKLAFVHAMLLSLCLVHSAAFAPPAHYQNTVQAARVAPLSHLQMSKNHHHSDLVDESPFQDVKTIGAQLHSILDVNNDGKLDVEDVKVAVRSILDVNGDGKVDVEDGKATAMAR